MTESLGLAFAMPVVLAALVCGLLGAAFNLALLHGTAPTQIRAILEDVVRPEGRVKIGSALAAFGQRFGGLDLNVTRDQSSPRTASFE